ncbi:MAG: hypothetical protein Q8O67_22090 [Deltaproteobacteria bacterium]|nr:hypothetical protein [Deltaproteobacteria bacterium]
MRAATLLMCAVSLPWSDYAVAGRGKWAFAALVARAARTGGDVHPVLTFVVAALLLIPAAAVLARAGDAIATHTGIGRVWIGAVLIAGATSLPELATDISAVRLGVADLAAGDLFGSSMANMLILAVIDQLSRNLVLRRAALDNTLAAGLAISVTALAAMFVLVRPTHGLWGIAPESIILVAIYIGGTRAVYRHAGRQAPGADAIAADVVVDGPAPVAQAAIPTLRRAIAQFVVAAVVILASAPFLAGAAKDLADLSGLGATFIGTLMVGLVTSLPELVTCLVAVRMGAFDLAVGNLFGSNAFNMGIFFAMDLAAPGPIFASLDPDHVVSALGGILLMSIGLAAIIYRAEKRIAFIEPDSLLMLVVYVGVVWLLYLHVTP